jgi:GrpE
MSSDHDNKDAAEKPEMHPVESAAAPATPAVDAERLATLERENADFRDRLLRTLADMENLRRRTEREMQDQRISRSPNSRPTSSAPPIISAARSKRCRRRMTARTIPRSRRWLMASNSPSAIC